MLSNAPNTFGEHYEWNTTSILIFGEELSARVTRYLCECYCIFAEPKNALNVYAA